MLEYDATTGRPLHQGTKAIETLDDNELEAELTIALLDPERRERRYDQLWQELLNRRHGNGRHRDLATNNR
jgi:hypothetical protein